MKRVSQYLLPCLAVALAKVRCLLSRQPHDFSLRKIICGVEDPRSCQSRTRDATSGLLASCLLLLASCLLSPLSLHAQVPCQTPPPVTKMDQHLYASLKGPIGAQKTRLAILPFYDGTQIESDNTLERGFAIAFYDILSSMSSLAVYHPYVIFNIVDARGMASKDLYNSVRALEVAREIGATHVVYGMFQKLPDNLLRYFVNMAVLENPGSFSPTLEYLTDQDTRFFSVAMDTAKDLSRYIGQGKINSVLARGYLQSVPNFQSYRFYLKGMVASRSYNLTDLSIAKVWFEKASSLSYDFYQAKKEEARSLLMTALILKQMQKDYSLYTLEAQKILRETRGSSGKKQKTPTRNSLAELRWYQGYEEYIEGISYLQSNLLTGAEQALSRAAHRVPEDGMSHYYLSQAYQRLGNPKAVSEIALARELNPCVR